MSMQIKRQPDYIKTEIGDIFYWRHHKPNLNNGKLAVVICPPLGHEYMSSYRTLRELANSFAENGLPAFRFDYINTGNSSDNVENRINISLCIQNIIDVCQFVRKEQAVEHVVCVGFGLGATFAALAAEKERTIDSLILWEPCIRGKRYLRGLKVLSGITSQNSEGSIDAGGLILNPSLESELNSLDALSIDYSNITNILLLYRDDVKPNANFEEKLNSCIGNVQTESFSGYVDMLTVPTDTVIPVQAIQQQVKFVLKASRDIVDNKKTNTKQLSSLLTQTFTEHPVYFGSQQTLFGIMTKSLMSSKSTFPIVVFLNCGSEHHVGPHRIYTHFARKLAKLSIDSFRIDLEGIGDSPALGGNIENFPYSPVAMSDIKEALTYLSQEGYGEYVLTGICAGAYHSFKASAEFSEFNIKQAIAINPLVFDWQKESAALKSKKIKRQEEANRYKKSFLNLTAWKRLFSGKVNVKNLIKTIWFGIILQNMNNFLNFYKREKNIVDLRLEKYIELGRKLTIIQAESDPGYDLLLNDAAKMTKECIQKNILTVDYIEDADHSLSKKRMREKLYALLEEKITKAT